MHPRLRRPAAALITTTLAASVLGIAPAAHAADGTVSGTVTGSGAAELADVSVELYQYNEVDQYWEPIKYTSTDDEGSYSFVVPAGPYRIGFADYQNGFVSEYYEDAATVRSADTVTVPSAGTLVADAELEPGAHITGEVTGPNGAGLHLIYVTAYEPVVDEYGDTYYQRAAGTATASDGSYDLHGLAGGDYRIEFRDDYDHSQDFATEWYDDATTRLQAEDVTVVAEGTTSGIDAELGVDAELSGRVTDATGAGVSGARVDALVKVGDEWEYTESAYTGDDGTYLLEGLRVGTYRVQFGARVGDDWAGEYWNDKPSLETAADVVIATGVDTGDIDAVLVPGEHDPVLLPYFDNTAAPVVSGAAQVGATLSATAGSWDPAPTTVEYFWYRDGEWIDGAFAATYVPTAADLGKQLTIQTVANGEGFERSYSDVSAPTAAVVAAPAAPAPTPLVAPGPAVSAPAALVAILEGVDVKGKPKVGKTLKVSGLDKLFRATTPVRYKIQWFAGKKAIKKATKSKLKVTRAMKGKKLAVKVTAKAASAKKSVRIKVGKVR